jgi:Zn-dependent protease with chaperone function
VRDRAHLFWRAVLAFALAVAFYGLALAAVAALLAAPVLVARASWGLAFKVALFCVVGAFLILKAIAPRRDRFEPPGPRLAPATQPRLFAEIRRIAEATGQAPPSEVYLVADVNAFVGHRGGLMGVGSRRVMGIGLPLLQLLTVAELRAVLAHEFGHFDGGDVGLGPWIYSTRSALLRTIEDLHDHSTLLAIPFVWYANAFFRATHAVSRHQETKADQLAARVAGPGPAAWGLRVIHDAELPFAAYWHGAVGPLLAAGFAPPLASGFETFLKAPWLDDARKHAEEAAPPSPYDTHPSLPARLAALGPGAPSAARDVGPGALSLLDGVPTLEARLAVFAAGKGEGRVPADESALRLAAEPVPLAPIRWEEVGTRVWLPDWDRTARKNRRLLKGVTPAGLPGFEWETLGRRIVAGDPEGEPLEAADAVVGIALAVVLARAGFAVESVPGAGPALRGLGERVEPFAVRERLAGGPDAAAAWVSFCESAGIAQADLGAIGEPGGASS